MRTYPTPAHFDAALTQARLDLVCAEFARVRDIIVAAVSALDALPGAVDGARKLTSLTGKPKQRLAPGSWTIGCAAHDVTQQHMERLASVWDFLGYSGQGLSYTLTFDGVPIRIHREGSRKKGLSKEEADAFKALEQLGLFNQLSGTPEAATESWRLRLEFQASGSDELEAIWLRLREPNGTLIAEWQTYQRDGRKGREGTDGYNPSPVAPPPVQELPPPGKSFLDESSENEDRPQEGSGESESENG